ncbi:MAG TPA: BlaI/MecI/CopY family transcriptional regulator [Kiritimatiellia bacterium]|jgi:BlaI family penicillinase repressor
MQTTPRISEAEWEVMRIAWERGTVTAQAVVDALGHKDWSPRTVKTLLNRLVKKGALAFQAQGKAYLYRPAVPMEKCVREESRSFLDRVFGGEAAPALAHFVKSAKLSPDEIKELKRILAEKSK